MSKKSPSKLEIKYGEEDDNVARGRDSETILKVIVVFSVLLILGGISTVIVAATVLRNSPEQTDSELSTRSVGSNNVMQKREYHDHLYSIRAKPKFKYRKNHFNVEHIVKHMQNNQQSSSVQTAWVKVESNKVFNGKKLDAYVHLMFSGTQEVTEGYVENVDDSNDPCLPVFTPGVNLTVPGAGYSIDIDSITTMNPLYAIEVVDGAAAQWNKLGVDKLFGARVAWDGAPDDPNAPDGKSQVVFGSISPSSVLAYTTVFGYFDSFPIQDRKIVEWDIFVGDASNRICDAVADSTCHHFPKIMVHEFGHATGLGHSLGGVTCIDKSVMYPSVAAGDTFPTLPQPLDILAHDLLYPASQISHETPGPPSPDTGTSDAEWAQPVFLVIIFMMVFLVV